MLSIGEGRAKGRCGVKRRRGMGVDVKERWCWSVVWMDEYHQCSYIPLWIVRVT